MTESTYETRESRLQLSKWIDLRILFPALLGALLAVVLYKFWDFHWRWMVIASGGLVGLSALCVLLGNVGRLGIYAFLFTIPIASIEKWFFLDMVYDDWVADQLWSGYIGLGPIDVVIAVLYLSWIFRIFVSKDAPFPRLERIDGLAFMLFAAYVISLLGAPNLATGLFSTGFLLKHLLAYFYVSRHILRQHLKWVVAAVVFAISIEATLAILQTQFHVLEGFARHKGANIEEVGEQVTVPGIENFKRAEGTTLDSHAFGIYVAMLLAFPFILMQDESQKKKMQAFYLGLFAFGTIAVVLSYSRSAWIGYAASIPWAFLLMWYAGHKRLGRSIGVSALLGLLLTPWVASFMVLRFDSAPDELITHRLEGYYATLPIIQEHWLFGFGVGNYLDALRVYSVNWAPELVVHNVFLFIWAESGIFGVIAWFGLILTVVVRCAGIAKRGKGLVRQLAYCPAIALAAYCIDGLAEPLYREPVVFMNFWFLVALTVALTRLHKEDQEADRHAALAEPSAAMPLPEHGPA